MQNFNFNSQVRVPKTSEIVAGKIRRGIVDGSIQSGGNLPSEARLIEMFEVSRPTIREAIRILEFENLVSVSRGARGGARVLVPSIAFVSRAMGVALQSRGVTLGDIYAARSQIEPVAARLAAETRPEAAAAALASHIASERDALQESVVITDYVAGFHRLLMDQCGNQTFALMGVALHKLVAQHHTLAHRNKPEPSEVTLKRSKAGVRSHERLVVLIAAGKGEEAENHWRIHMAKAGEFFLSDLAEKTVVDILEAETWS